ncbi:SDR family NAD(P)-dependent oxidoreductase [Limisalsivibrio acetivorans]|uniref:SDR family NAD(P)-dependent oxidoreductase n=1 Tax=Limisalsivibrio acetivorans TaxID=1304888 RepID=UPI0003B5C43A|nr:SDR family NAD(P)-dependent oxidoreductase [Limisalsivibrio acetivorans]
MKKILVTGAAGFIGWYTAKLLLEQGISVVGIDDLNSYYDVRLKSYRLNNLEERENFTFIKGDIADMEAMEGVFAEHSFDAVINLAARAGVRYSLENPHIYLRTNTQGTLVLLELMRKHGIRKFVLASTSSLYAGQKMPFSENLPVNTPISPYAASKKGAEVMAYTYHFHYGIDVSVVRYFTVYGPAGRPDMSIFRFIKWIDEGTPLTLYGDGTQSRDFTYVEDIARGTVAALKDVGYEIINLGGGKRPVQLNEVISTIEKSLGKQAVIDRKEFHSADMTETRADINKARELLGWEPEIDLDEGLERSIRWYRENIDWLRDVSVQEQTGLS